MECVRYWSVVIAADRYDTERLYQRDGLVVSGLGSSPMAAGDGVVLVAATRTPVAFGIGTVRDLSPVEGGEDRDDGAVVITYLQRMFDAPRPVPQSLATAALTEIDEPIWAGLARPVEVEAPSTWLVSLDLPIEAPSAAEAVRVFWTYVAELGPQELPTFVSPAGNELAMQAMVGGIEVNLDPEEDEG